MSNKTCPFGHPRELYTPCPTCVRIAQDIDDPSNADRAREVCACANCQIPGWGDANKECKAYHITKALDDAEKRGAVAALVRLPVSQGVADVAGDLGLIEQLNAAWDAKSRYPGGPDD